MDAPLMDITSPRGTKVRFAYPTHGYPKQGEDALRLLELNKVYTVEYTTIGGGYSTVKLCESHIHFNTVLFAPA